MMARATQLGSMVLLFLSLATITSGEINNEQEKSPVPVSRHKRAWIQNFQFRTVELRRVRKKKVTQGSFDRYQDRAHGSRSKDSNAGGQRDVLKEYTKNEKTSNTVGVRNTGLSLPTTSTTKRRLTPLRHGPKAVDEKLQCRGRDVGHYRDELRCEKYFRCVHGRPMEFSCPQGTLWDQEMAICDWAHRVDCSKGMAPSGRDQLRLVVSGYSDQLRTFTVDQSGHVLEGGQQDWKMDTNPTWLQIVDKSIYALHEVNDYEGVSGGAVSRWEMRGDTLVRQEWVSTQSGGPAHILVDKTHQLVYAANYGGGSLTVIGMEGDRLGEVVFTQQFGAGCRDASHPHQVVGRGDWIWLVDLGCDVVRTYRVLGGGVELVNSVDVEAGAGPRHMALHPTRPLSFLLCELKSLVEVYQVDHDTGTLTLKQQLQLASGNEDNFGAEILVHPGGEYVFASSRGRGVVVVYKLTADDMLERVREVNVGATWPRGVALSENGDLMAVVDQKGNSLQLIQVNSQTGELTLGEVVQTTDQPAFVEFYTR